MAIFKSSTGINSITDKSVRNYLAELNENLTYMFQNLTPDDNNAASVPKLTYVQDGEKAGRFEISTNGITAQLTDADNIVATINLSSEGIAIQADKISIEGLVTANENFWIDEEGSMGAKNGTFSGLISATIISSSNMSSTKITASEISSSNMSSTKITASEISSSSMTLGGSGTQGVLTVLNSSGRLIGKWSRDGLYVRSGDFEVGDFSVSEEDTYIGGFHAYTQDSYHYLALQDGTMGMGDHPSLRFWAGGDPFTANPPFRVDKKGIVYTKSLYTKMSDDWDGYTVGEAIDWIWDNWPG